MIDVEVLRDRWTDTALAPWAERLPEQVEAGLSQRRYGDLPRWLNALSQLPEVATPDIALDSARVRVGNHAELAPEQRDVLLEALKGLHPWRKGPFEFFGRHVDTEWRSDFKWNRLAPHITSLQGRRVLDVGCGNGYHCWRMRGAGAEDVIGIDPSPLFCVQFAALQRYIKDPAVNLIPVGVEGLPTAMHAFDTVFSMGVLYHRRSPIDHLQTLKDCLVPGGQLVLETLVIEGGPQDCLVPVGRYARMGNVWFLPSSEMLLLWLQKLGFRNPRVVDESVTSTNEQRSTDWMTFQSLKDFLDPKDASKTLEGYPAPRRAIVLAETP